MVAGFQRAARKGKPRCTDIIQASASVTFAHFPLAKASHVAEPGVNGGTLRATAHRIMDTRRGKIYGHCLQSAVAQIRLYFVPCTRRTVLNLLGLNLFQEFNLKKKNQSYVGRPGRFLRLEISNWQLIRNRFYLSSSTFRNFSLFLSQHLKS